MSALTAVKQQDGSYSVDIRGWMCPYPKYMLEPLLKKMAGRQKRISLLVDCPSAATDVPDVARKMGYKVPEVSQIGDGEWRIIIE